MNRYGVGVPENALIALAKLVLKRAKRSMPVDNAQQAIAVIRGFKPAISKETPLHHVVKSAVHKLARESRCSACGKALPFGSLCRMMWNLGDGTHIQCDGKGRWV